MPPRDLCPRRDAGAADVSLKIAPTHHASAKRCHKANFEIEVAYQQSEIGGGDIRSWRLTLESAVDGVSKKVTQAGTLSCLLPPIAETTEIGTKAWLFAKLQPAEPGRELTQPSPRLSADVCTETSSVN